MLCLWCCGCWQVIYTRERSAQVYSTFAYWASMAIVNLPLLFFSHAIFVSIAYWMIGTARRAHSRTRASALTPTHLAKLTGLTRCRAAVLLLLLLPLDPCGRRVAGGGRPPVRRLPDLHEQPGGLLLGAAAGRRLLLGRGQAGTDNHTTSSLTYIPRLICHEPDVWSLVLDDTPGRSRWRCSR